MYLVHVVKYNEVYFLSAREVVILYIVITRDIVTQ